MNGFIATPRVFAFPSGLLANAESMRLAYGAEASLAPGIAEAPVVRSLLCARDRADGDLPRALVLGQTAVPMALSDGRLALCGLWSVAAVAAFEAGQIPGGAEITLAELQSLTPETDL